MCLAKGRPHRVDMFWFSDSASDFRKNKTEKKREGRGDPLNPQVIERITCQLTTGQNVSTCRAKSKEVTSSARKCPDGVSAVFHSLGQTWIFQYLSLVLVSILPLSTYSFMSFLVICFTLNNNCILLDTLNCIVLCCKVNANINFLSTHLSITIIPQIWMPVTGCVDDDGDHIVCANWFPSLIFHVNWNVFLSTTMSNYPIGYTRGGIPRNPMQSCESMDPGPTGDLN